MAANRGLKSREKSIFFLLFVGDCVLVYGVFKGLWVLGFLGSKRELRGFVGVNNRDLVFEC